MKMLLKISALALAMGLSQGANAATINLGTLNLQDSKVLKDTIVGKNIVFNDVFKFSLSGLSDVAGSLISSFSSSSSKFASFSAKLYSSASPTLAIADFAPVTVGKTLTGGFNLSNLSAANTYEIRVNGQTGNVLKTAYSGSIAVSSVPEAEEWAMMMLGLGLVGMQLRRKSNVQHSITMAA